MHVSPFRRVPDSSNPGNAERGAPRAARAPIRGAYPWMRVPASRAGNILSRPSRSRRLLSPALPWPARPDRESTTADERGSIHGGGLGRPERTSWCAVAPPPVRWPIPGRSELLHQRLDGRCGVVERGLLVGGQLDLEDP